MDELERRLAKPLSLKRFAQARFAIWELTTRCTEELDAVLELQAVVSRFFPDHPALVDVITIVEEIGTPPLLSEDQERQLVLLLDGYDVEVRRSTFHGVFGNPLRKDDPHWSSTARHVRFVELTCRTKGGLPLLLTYLEQTAHAPSHSDLLHPIHTWISDVGANAGLDPAVLRALCPSPASEGSHFSRNPGLDATRAHLDNSHALGSGEESDDPSAGAGDEAVNPTSTRHKVPADVVPPIRGNLPIRNTDFTGRGPLIWQLRESLLKRSNASVVPQALHGLGGVGKTQLAVEYAYRYIDYYGLIWWINADHITAVRSSLAELGRELGIPPSPDIDQSAKTVLNSLATSTRRWLLVYDNADNPEDLAGLLPPTEGHVIITSRNGEWSQVYDAIEVDVLERHESVQLIQRKTGDAIPADEADHLAEKVGDLPLALEQAAAWHSATGMPVERYLALFDKHVEELMGENKPANYPASVSAFLRVAFDKLREGSVPEAPQLLELFAHLGPDPVAAAFLRSGRGPGISEPLRQALGDEIKLNRAISALRRHGLAKVLPGQQLQVHRLVQLVLREGLLERRRERSRENVRIILQGANPGDPDNRATWPRHREIGPHIGPADLLGAPTADARRVALDQARYLYSTGDYAGSRDLAETMISRWSGPAEDGGIGADHEHTLLAKRHLANALRQLGHYERARLISTQTLETLRASPEFGDDHEHTVAVGLGLGYDLRLSGDIAGAHRSDEENYARARRTYDDDDVADALHAKNNVTASLKMLGDFDTAYRLDTELVQQWRSSFGDQDARTLRSISNVARDLYGLGRYAEALETQRLSLPEYVALLSPDHTDVLQANRTIAIALRKTGRYGEALTHARETYEAFRTRFGPDYEHTLSATMTFANTLRTVGQFTEAKKFADEGVEAYVRVLGERHPLTLAARVNLGIILRAIGDLRDAREVERSTYEDLRAVVGERHPHTLCAAGNYSNSLVLAGDTAAARALSEPLLNMSRQVRGDAHPYTLGIALNVSLDLRNAGEADEARDLFGKTIARLRDILGTDHPEVLHASQDRRADFDIEPPPM
ncbi:FxSxx-COOH system tetratricopeptide repeat protein [Virgisporangium aliadipatigenens]|uniref:FxSxx-COOH system tetratricopeptide repeat protein n=1 Tax=Virgisporangium aliadipatigenens TaxID=741659 RepID=UPI00357159D5